MSDQAPRNTTYQARAAIQAFKHSALALGALALGHARSAAGHTKAAAAWGALAVCAAAIVKAGTPQWLLDATWVEPLDYLDEMPTEFESEEAN